MKIFVNVTLLKTKPLLIYSISCGEVVLENMKIFVNVTLLLNPPPLEEDLVASLRNLSQNQPFTYLFNFLWEGCAGKYENICQRYPPPKSLPLVYRANI